MEFILISLLLVFALLGLSFGEDLSLESENRFFFNMALLESCVLLFELESVLFGKK